MATKIYSNRNPQGFYFTKKNYSFENLNLCDVKYAY